MAGTPMLLDLGHRALVRIEGSETADLLQRITSQDALGMAPGDAAPACILTAKGKLLALFELFRADDDLFLAETDRERAAGLVELIDRFIFAEQVTVFVAESDAVGIFGAAAPELAGSSGSGVEVRGTGWLLRSEIFGMPGLRLHAPRPEIDAFVASAGAIARGGFEDYERLRIDAAWPRPGVDADDTTIPLEVNLDAACDPDKGCYIGQEVIARIRTYGHVNRKLCRLAVEASATFETGTPVFDADGDAAGRITSSYVTAGGRQVHALAMLPQVLATSSTRLTVAEPGGAAAVVC